MTPEEKDRKILAELQANSDRPQKILAGTIGIKESDLTKRKQHLKQSGVIVKYTVELDYEQLGYNTVGFFVFSEQSKTENGTEEIIDFLNGIDEIIEVHKISAQNMDFIVKIMCKNNKHFDSVISRIRSHPNVRNETAFSALALVTTKQMPGVPLDKLNAL
jgi:Lrp/AsnC family transcriptional regulator, leucine-responsive regulatory protein